MPVLTTLHQRDYRVERLVAKRDGAISVCRPARNEAATIGRIVDALMPSLLAGAIAQVVVLDGASGAIGDIARAACAKLTAGDMPGVADVVERRPIRRRTDPRSPSEPVAGRIAPPHEVLAHAGPRRAT